MAEEGADEEAGAADAEPVVKEEETHPNDDEAEADGDITMRAEDHEAADEAEGTNTAAATENEADVEDAAEPEEEPAVEEEEVAVEVEVEGEQHWSAFH